MNRRVRPIIHLYLVMTSRFAQWPNDLVMLSTFPGSTDLLPVAILEDHNGGDWRLNVQRSFPCQSHWSQRLMPGLHYRFECLVPAVRPRLRLFPVHKQFNVPFGIFPAEVLGHFYDVSCFDWPPTPNSLNRLQDAISPEHARDCKTTTCGRSE